jgi:hypothetical protein
MISYFINAALALIIYKSKQHKLDKVSLSQYL